MIYVLLGVLLGAVLGVCLYLRKKLMDIEELCLRIAATTSLAENRAEERFNVLGDAIDHIHCECCAERNPDAPDAEEKSAEEKKAEKEFTEGIYNILNYSSRKGMGS